MRKLMSWAVVAMLAVLAPGAAAHAAPVPPELTMGRASVPPGGEDAMPLTFRSLTPTGSRQPFDLVFDITATREFVTIDVQSSDCETAATTVTCSDTGGEASTWVKVTARPGVPIGTTLSLPGRMVVDGRTLARATGTITIAEQVSLAGVDTQDDVSIASGATGELTASVRNTGDKPITGVVLQLRTANGIRAADHANCERVEAPFAFPSESGANCVFDEELAPGQTYRLATPLRVTVTDQVWAPSGWYSAFTWSTTQDFLDRGGKLPAGGTGPELDLDAPPARSADPQTETGVNDDSETYWKTLVTGRNASTFTVKGDEVSGRVGRNVTVRVSVRNNGPARLEGANQEPGSSMVTVVTPPAGTRIVKWSKNCWPFSIGHPAPYPPFPADAEIGDGKVYCWPGDFNFPVYLPGETYAYDITLRVTEPGTLRGSYTTLLADSGVPIGPVKQQAPIIVHATAAPASGGGDDDGGTGGGLPITGTNLTAVALTGLGLLVAGAAALFVTRRRSVGPRR